MKADTEYLNLAIDQARMGLDEGGIPVGSALVVGDEIIATGRNRRVQLGSATRHAEIDCLENAGRLSATTYKSATLYSTLSPCQMCAGAVLLYGIPRIVIGENQTFEVSESLLRSHGLEVVVLDTEMCVSMMRNFIASNPRLWNEDIGVDDLSIAQQEEVDTPTIGKTGRCLNSK
jgi:cytosine/creatinine deaminase